MKNMTIPVENTETKLTEKVNEHKDKAFWTRLKSTGYRTGALALAGSTMFFISEAIDTNNPVAGVFAFASGWMSGGLAIMGGVYARESTFQSSVAANLEAQRIATELDQQSQPEQLEPFAPNLQDAMQKFYQPPTEIVDNTLDLI
jgi:hypothetical protein